jgi:hypothetical protein
MRGIQYTRSAQTMCSKDACFNRLIRLGGGWSSILPTLLRCLLVPYLRCVLHATYGQIAAVLIITHLSSLVACFLSSHYVKKFSPSLNHKFLLLVIIPASVMIIASMLLSTMQFRLNIGNNETMTFGVGLLVVLLCGMTEFSRKVCQHTLHSIYKIHEPKREFANIWNRVLGILIGGAILWIPIDSLNDVHILFALGNVVTFLFVAFAILVLYKSKMNPTESDYQETVANETKIPTGTPVGRLLSLLERISSVWAWFLSLSLLMLRISEVLFLHFLTDCYLWRRGSTSSNPESDASYIRDAMHFFTYTLALGILTHLVFHFSEKRFSNGTIARSFVLLLGALFMIIIVVAFSLLVFVSDMPAFTLALVLLGVSKVYDLLATVLEMKLSKTIRNSFRKSTPTNSPGTSMEVDSITIPQTEDSTKANTGNRFTLEQLLRYCPLSIEELGSCIGVLVSSLVLEFSNYSELLKVHTDLAICCLVFVILCLLRYSEIWPPLRHCLKSCLSNPRSPPQYQAKPIILFKRPRNFT